MSIYAIIYLALSGTGLLISANKHGKENTGTHNFWDTALTVVIVYPLLYLGGFFN